MSLSTATNLVFLNSATRPGTITLPLTTTIPGRTLTLKDITGAAAASTITVTTSGSETFEDGTTSKTITTAFGYLTLAGNAGKWYVTDTTQPTAFTVSTLSTQTLTANSTIAKAITASTATISSLTAGVLAASTIQAPTVSSLIGLTSSLQANTVSSQTVTASNVQANFLSSLATQTSSLQANTISSQSILTSSIQANAFSSITLWASTINGYPIGAAFTGSTTYLSAAITNIQQGLISSVSANTITTVTLSTMAFYVSSINGLLPTGSGSTNYLSAGIALMSSATIANLAATQGYVSSLVVDSFQIGSNAAFINMGDVIATSLSTIQLNTGILYTNSTFIGSSSNQTAVQFYGNTGGYNNTALAEVSTGSGTQEFVVFRGSSASDRIRMQTTGNIVFETGVASRLWPNVASNVTPALIINTASNVGIQTATPAFPLDVAGTARAQILSSFAINVSSINGYIPVGAFTGSSIYLSSAQATLGTQVNISSIANFSTGNIALFSTPSVSSQFTITDTQLSTVSTTLSQILTKPTYQVASTTTYSYTGAYQTVTASTNWTHVFVQMWGAGGAGGLGSAGLVGGGGAYIQGYIPVTAGESLTLIVGQGGQYNAAGVAQQTDAQGGGGGSGTNAGGGGGRTAIQRNSTDVVVAGGGGAASGTAGTGGAATWSGVAWSGGNFVRQTATYLTSNAGGGGQTVGGSSAIAAYNGTKALGGTTTIASAGGGGAGWYGGGGSANSSTGAGGGSSYTDFLLAAAGYDAALSTPGFYLSPLRAATGAGQGGAGIGAAGSNGLVYITPFTAVNNYKLFAFGTTLMPTMTSIDNVGAVRIWRDTIDPNWALDVGARSRFQYVEAATVSTLTLNTSNINVSSINGTVYGVFAGSTTYLSAATASVSSLTTNVLTVSTALVKSNGTAAPTSYGLGVDTLTLQTTNAGYSAGIASMAFATATTAYPLARIYAVDSAASGPAVSQLVFQTVPTSATSFSSNFTYTGATTTLTIPTGVTSVNVQMWGAGGGGYQGVGGAGAFVQGTLAVTPNQVLTILVGSGGSSNTTIFGGGGGAGAYFASVGGGGRAAVQLNFSLQPVPITITGLSGSGSSAVVTTSGVHGLSIGQPVTISGASPYNGIYVVIAVTSNTFTIPTTTTGSVTLSSPNIIAELAIAGGGGSGGYQASGIGGYATFSGSGSSGLPFGGGGGGQYNSSTPLQGGSNGGGSPSGYASPLQGTGGVNYAGQGGGGYYGGGGGGGSPTTGNVYSGGGGGSSYTSLLTSVTGSNSVDGITPPATSVAGYVTGVAKGGAANGAPNSASWGGNAQIIIGTVGNSYSEAMRIGTTGNVGIGTAAPATLLDVAGTSRSQAMSTLSFNASSINGIPVGAQALGIQTLAF
jgi:Glycine rich protein